MAEINDALLQDVQQLSQPSPIIELFEIDLSSVGGEVFRFVNSLRFGKTVKFKGNVYYPVDFETDGWDISTQGTLPTPTIRISNITGLLTAAMLQYNDLLGLPLKRIRTYEKYLDQLSIVENVVKRIDQSDYTNFYNFGDYDTGRDGVLKLSTDEGSGVIVDFIIVNGEQISAQSIFEDVNGETGGTWYPAWVSDTYNDSDNWDDNGFWEETQRLAYFSDVVGSYINFPLPNDIQGDIIVRIPEYVTEDSNLIMNLKTYELAATSNINFEEEEFIIEQKVTENRVYVEFKMSSYMDREGVMLPGRKYFKDYCPWRYRVWNGSEFEYGTCPYTGSNYFNKKGERVLDPSLDSCNKKFASCRLRFPTNAEIPYGGFPGLTR